MDKADSQLLKAFSDAFSGALPGAQAIYPSAVVRLAGDASSREYFRIQVAGGNPASYVAMRLPEDPHRSDEQTSEQLGACDTRAEIPFLSVARWLATRGVPVPKIFSRDASCGIVLLEDLGDQTFEHLLLSMPRTEWASAYERAVDLLASMHHACDPNAPNDRRECLVYSRRFDRALLRSELHHFFEWGLEPFGPVDGDSAARLHQGFDELADEIAALSTGFVHRDYQSRNLMVRPSGELVVIDFQDALIGPAPYDLVALLCDSYVALELNLQRAMIRRYLEQRAKQAAVSPIDDEEFERAFWLVAAQRKLKDAGRFVFIDRVRKNPKFLQWFPESLVYAGRALKLSGRDTLYREIARIIPGFPNQVEAPQTR